MHIASVMLFTFGDIFVFVNVNMNGVQFVLLLLLSVGMFNWLRIQKQMKSGIFGLPCDWFFLLLVLNLLNAYESRIDSDRNRTESNQIELIRFIWMNGIDDLCRWHYQIHRIQLKFRFVCVSERKRERERTTNACTHLYGWKLNPSKAKHFICCCWCLNFGS